MVDTHTHLLPDRLAAKIRRFFVDRGVARFPYSYLATEAREALARAGIARCWNLPYAHRAGVAAGLNRWMAETWSSDSGVVPGATVHPGDDVHAVVDEAVRLELSVFKLHCSVGDFDPDDERLDPLWRRVSEEGWPVVVHAGRAPEGMATDSEIERVARVALRWPDARIVIAHSGSPSERAALDLVRRSRSVYADLCPVVGRPVSLDRAAIAGIERRILFGSDVPTVAVTIESGLERVRRWRLDAEDEAAVLGGTANSLLGL